MNQALVKKRALRTELRETLRQIHDEEYAEGSDAIAQAIQGSALWKKSNCVLAYMPIQREPNIFPLILDGLKNGKTVALPRFAEDLEAYQLAVIRDPAQDLAPGRYGVPEPADHCASLPLNRLDLSLIPGLGFDYKGRRLGRGKGFYDRLLAGASGTKAGLAFDAQLQEALPCEAHDVVLNCIITPSLWIDVDSDAVVK